MVLIEDLGLKYPTNKSNKKYRYGLYKCPVCNDNFEVMTKSVLSGSSTKCRDCSNKKRRKFNIKNNRIYVMWRNMKARCLNAKHDHYKYYGAIGITIDSAWVNDYDCFQDWALSNGYTDELTIDREDVLEGYTASNCRFVGADIQAQNQRLLRSTNTSGYRGVNFNISLDKWIARCYLDDKRVHIGSFDNPKDGAIAYDNFIILNNLEQPLNFKKKEE